MPDPNALVALVARIDPPADRMSPAEVLRQSPSGVTIELDGERPVRLLPSDVAPGLLSVLEQLRRLRTPVYVEIQPDTRAITRLRIPLVTRVTRIDERGTEGFMVELDASHARHRVVPGGVNAQEVLDVLRRAVATRALLAVTETDRKEIIDARPWGQEPPRGEQPREGPPGAEPSRPAAGGLLKRIWQWITSAVSPPSYCVTPKQAQQLFDLAAGATCDPLAVPPPCIPFLYPDDGCWARAHEMYRLLTAAGAGAAKIWISGALITPTRNHPECGVRWAWHVAPTLCVRRRVGLLWSTESMVIDPSLFTTPVSLATWKGAQGDPGASLVPSAGPVYWFNGQLTDNQYVGTNWWLAYFRAQLLNRSLGPDGPPPYAACP